MQAAMDDSAAQVHEWLEKLDVDSLRNFIVERRHAHQALQRDLWRNDGQLREAEKELVKRCAKKSGS